MTILCRRLLAFSVGIALITTPIFQASAASTTKTLSTNFTVVNLGPTEASVTAQYLKDDGTSWTSDVTLTSFTVPANGGQIIFRQYGGSPLASGQGSVVLSSDQPLGTVVQIRAVEPGGQVPTEGAYSGFLVGAPTVSVPLVARRLVTGSGVANSQVVIQNTGGGTAAVEVQLIGTGLPSGAPFNYTKSGISIAPGVSYYYDLEEETALPGDGGDPDTMWYGSATITSTGSDVAVVTNFFMGAHGMQTYMGFPTGSSAWYAPLFTSRLANGLSTPISVQNVSGGSIPIGALQLHCTASAGSPAPSTIDVANTTLVGDKASYHFSPLADTVNFPAGWFGICTVSSGAYATVAYVQMRFIGTDNVAAYEAIPAGGTDTTAYVPLVAQRLANGFATAVTAMNLGGSSASVTLEYVPNAACGGCLPYSFSTTIPVGVNLIQNHRLGGDMNGDAVRDLPDGWYGTLKITCTNGQPINGFVQLTNVLVSSGDTFQAHTLFTTAGS
jgi:hypothetical protein